MHASSNGAWKSYFTRFVSWSWFETMAIPPILHSPKKKKKKVPQSLGKFEGTEATKTTKKKLEYMWRSADALFIKMMIPVNVAVDINQNIKISGKKISLAEQHLHCWAKVGSAITLHDACISNHDLVQSTVFLTATNTFLVTIR